MGRIIFKSRIEAMLLDSGELIYINQYKEFNEYIKQYNYTNFAKHYKLFNNQVGVYRFNINGICYYIGYSENLKDRVRRSFFNNCMGYNNITFQYILADTKQQAIDIESYYIKSLQPTKNYMSKKGAVNTDVEYPEFCNEMEIHFNNYYTKDKYINIPPIRRRYFPKPPGEGIALIL
jgi:hypothetical protein